MGDLRRSMVKKRLLGFFVCVECSRVRIVNEYTVVNYFLTNQPNHFCFKIVVNFACQLINY